MLLINTCKETTLGDTKWICSLMGPTNHIFQNLNNNIILFNGPTDPFYLNIEIIMVILQCSLLNKF